MATQDMQDLVDAIFTEDDEFAITSLDRTLPADVEAVLEPLMENAAHMDKERFMLLCEGVALLADQVGFDLDLLAVDRVLMRMLGLTEEDCVDDDVMTSAHTELGAVGAYLEYAEAWDLVYHLVQLASRNTDNPIVLSIVEGFDILISATVAGR